MHPSQDWLPLFRNMWIRIFSRLNGRSASIAGTTWVLLLTVTTTVQSQAPDNDPIGLPRSLQPAEIRSGWLSLFDGESLFGWQNVLTADWIVAEGCLTAREGKSPGLLATTTQFDCYQLRLDFWASAKTNSGIFLRTSPKPKSPSQDCIELNIAPRSMSPFPTGSLVDRRAIEGEVTTETWHRFDIQVLPHRIIVQLDGQEIIDEEILGPAGRGFIGLQYNQGEVRFCNVFLKPLVLRPLFNGRDLSGWRTYPQMDTRATVTEDGSLQLTGGRGQIESMGTFGDFLLQLECKTLAAGTNSGVFFRCIPTEQMNGYETQIQNEVIDGDARRPADCGTGGIFRRVDARRVQAKDNEWFNLTLIAVGPHISTWVNGLQVTDWQDDREPDLNPRRGLRLQPGTLMLQGHDPESLVQFRNINVTELGRRQR
jgi:hypothetical protein